ncbi:hypothetical protein [Nocardioides salarius]|uniref:Uncharacterized protein YndB with AHSA1/START domain n=1 Tax=Nocardioides salarius TaxID=374513 RepID=A0ABS2M882_9ACTN|nr:hypothetical protein [Nocardioides salarius]MBM7507379.1 uncharacterized protein YndB with AHSA1/START domain [Nocardioides salarius]
MSAPDDPLHHAVDVACDARRAFEVFTDLGSWWDPASTPDPEAFGGIEATPGVGGEVVLRLDGTPRPLGRVTAWEPGAHYAQTYLPHWWGPEGTRPTWLDVTFTDEGGVCLVELRHGGWDSTNLVLRQRCTDWPDLLGRFARACAG